MNAEDLSPIPSIEGIRDADARIGSFVKESPLVLSPLLSDAFGREVLLKLETASPIASFKLRGALVDVSRAIEAASISRVATSSSGNHGQGVALAARLLDVSADVFLPSGANCNKADVVAALGAKLHWVDGDLYEAKRDARVFSESEGAHFVDDGASVDVMEGAGTIGLELADQLTGASVVFVPVGDGGLIGGTVCALKSQRSDVVVIGCQAEGAPSLTRSFWKRELIDVPANTVADGICSRKPTPLALNAMRMWVDEAMLVRDDEILSGVRTFIEDGHVLVEPAAAAALAAAWRVRNAFEGRAFVLIVSGANITRSVLKQALRGPPLYPSRQSSLQTATQIRNA